MSDHPVRLPPLRRSKTTIIGTVEWFEPAPVPWGSQIFVDPDGKPIKRADGQALRQCYIDRDGNPVLTSDGQPVHAVFDEHGREVTDEDGRSSSQSRSRTAPA